MISTIFQSTRPIRGATCSIDWRCADAWISIHAPHTGRDDSQLDREWGAAKYFNPRAPYGARPCGDWGFRRINKDFNPRAPYGARRQTVIQLAKLLAISIHAPHTGRDHKRRTIQPYQRYFNPRAPYGARPPAGPQCQRYCAISIHAPHTGRDVTVMLLLVSVAISIHAPHTGRDGCCLPVPRVRSLFQSTRPIRGATKSVLLTVGAG